MNKGVTRASSHPLQNAAPFLNLRPSWVLCSCIITNSRAAIPPCACIFNRNSTFYSIHLYRYILASILVWTSDSLLIIHTANPPGTFPFPDDTSLWKTRAAAKAWNISAGGSHPADHLTASKRIPAPFLNRVPVRMVLRMEKTSLPEVPLKPVDHEIHNFLKHFNVAEITKITLYQVLLWSPNPGVYKELGTSQTESWTPIPKPGADAHGAALVQGTKNNFSPSSKPISSKEKQGRPSATRMHQGMSSSVFSAWLESCVFLHSGYGLQNTSVMTAGHLWKCCPAQSTAGSERQYVVLKICKKNYVFNTLFTLSHLLEDPSQPLCTLKTFFLAWSSICVQEQGCSIQCYTPGRLGKQPLPLRPRGGRAVGR